MNLEFACKNIHSIEDLYFFMKHGFVGLNTAKEWILTDIRNGNDQFLDFVWLQDKDAQEIDTYVKNKNHNSKDNLLQSINRRNLILIKWLSSLAIPYEEFIKLIEEYYCNVDHPTDLEIFIPYMPMDDKYPVLSADTFKQICNMYLANPPSHN